MPNINSRLVNFLTFLYVSSLIIFALYLQYFQGLQPCPLCMLQRVVFIAVGIIALLATLHNPSKVGIRIYSIINTIFCCIGLGLAGRHIWLESLPPDQAPACGPSLEIMLEYLPLTDVITKAIIGTGDCAKIDWTMFGLSIADWSFAGFSFLLLVSLYLLVKPVKQTI